ncbi:SH3 domain-containing protein [Aureimonas mangrovi]|uniref:SH3 domain-containing protein n=1 Tax=Aureimonas mangrovi TaxID=2758041 RepID=UPI003CCCFFA9
MALRTVSSRLLLASIALGFAALAAPAKAQENSTEVASLETRAAPQENRSASGLPLPRFVSLKASRVNLRVGPGRDYPVSWLYLKQGLPVEVIQEYDNWRRVRDAEGAEGWVYHSLLSGERTAVAAPWLKGKSTTVEMRRDATAEARVVALMEPGVVTRVEQCSFGWCRVQAGETTGFVSQNDIWGVYPDERF